MPPLENKAAEEVSSKKSLSSSSSFEALPVETPSQKSQLSRSNKILLSSFIGKTNLDNEAVIEPFGHSFTSLKINRNASRLSIRSEIRKAKKLLEGELRQADSLSLSSKSTDTTSSSLSSLSTDSMEESSFSEKSSTPPRIKLPSLDSFSSSSSEMNSTSSSIKAESSTKTDSSSEDKSFAAFSISRKDFTAIEPTLFLKDPSRRELRKVRAKLDQCIDLDPSILLASGSTRVKKIKVALSQLNTPKTDSSTLTSSSLSPLN
jgi:hypothetical protein